MAGTDLTVDERYTLENRHDDDIVDSSNVANPAKREIAKQALLAVLPPFDQLARLFNSNSDWWQTWRRKCSGTSGTEQTLPQFAAQALSTYNMGAIGMVVLSAGICSSNDSDDLDRYVEAVDRWVLADDEYAASLEGMECLILKSKWYADVGQPRRAWIAYRKGLMYAQLMVRFRVSAQELPLLIIPRACTGNVRLRLLMKAFGGHYTTGTASYHYSWVSHTLSTTRIAISPCRSLVKASTSTP